MRRTGEVFAASLGGVLWILAAAAYGGLVGVLLPRAAYRLSVEPEDGWRDRCPDGHPVGRWTGPARCGECAPPGRYGPPTAPVAAATALLCSGVAAATGPHAELAVWLVAVPVGLLLGLVDVAVRRLPDMLTLPLAGAVLALLGAVRLAAGPGAGTWPGALLGAVALGGFYLLLVLVNPDGMGFGDAKLAVAIGAALGWYGWDVLLAGAFLGLLLGAVYGVGLMVVRRAGRKESIPMGPFMLAGAYAALLLGAAGA
ncbi:prepilin peptidase [Streptomyces sp. NPDC060194]|uniref:prepilin peptidase n=1 Tax=Streptomyces sp. NPDC060194 TaxID=3347069 RepID=UPI00364E5D74